MKAPKMTKELQDIENFFIPGSRHVEQYIQRKKELENYLPYAEWFFNGRNPGFIKTIKDKIEKCEECIRNSYDQDYL